MAPDALAVTDGVHSLSYLELEHAANRIGAALAARGTGPGDLVPVLLSRLGLSVAVLLGVLKTGAAYVPLDPALPATRLAAMLTAAHGGLVVACGDTADVAATLDADVLLVEPGTIADLPADPLPPRSTPGDVAYVLFTSGTSGEPKGVVVHHRAAHHFTTAIIADYGIGPDDRLAQFASYGFDVSVFEIFAALVAGATLVVVPDEDKYMPNRLVTVLRKQRVTVAELPPTLLAVLDPVPLPDLRLISVGGEAFSSHVVRRWAIPGRRFVNGYGPTECTVAVTLFNCPPGMRTSPLIGRPMANHRTFVLDERLRPVPEGVAGELCVAGPQVVTGYLGDAALTATRFPPNPYASGREDDRLYRTGDRVRRLGDGELEFLGRLDRQVKIRGFRVELAEIELGLASHPAVQRAVARLVEVSGRPPMLVAYVTGAPDSAPPDERELRAHLIDRLPSYMIPHALVVLDEFPLTANGKTDASALATPRSGDDADPSATEFADELAALIVRDIVAPLLPATTIRPDTDFFEAGGDSIQAITCVAAISARFHVEVGLADFLAEPTAAQLARLVRARPQPAGAARSTLLRMLDDIDRGTAAVEGAP
jgi:amino acid adenylation domain-containing protein